MQLLVVVLLILLSVGLDRGLLQAKVLMTQEQALREAFAPAGRAQRKTLFLSGAQAAQVEKLARCRLPSSIISYYVAESSSGARETAFFERRVVRTMPVTFMVVVGASGEVDRVEVLGFEEPQDYLPRPRWLELFRGRVLNDELALGRGLPRVTGASLTSQAVNDGVRTALAVYQVAVKGR